MMPVDDASPEAPRAARALFFAVVLVLPVADLLTAALYARTGSVHVELIRQFRDLATAVLGLLGLVTTGLPAGLRFVALLYGGFVALYSATALFADLPPGVIIGSAGTLMLPVLMTSAAAYSVRRMEQLQRLIQIIILYGLATTLFGLWDIDHTEFWAGVVDLGGYLREVKGISTGYDPVYQLPWNFQGFAGARRAAGLLAAPLAQGSFLAIAAIVSFATLRRRWTWLGAGAAAIFCIVGVYQSGTRGAILMTLVALIAYFALPSGRGARSIGGALIPIVLVAAFYVASGSILQYTLAERDGSTVGHVDALHKNLDQIGRVALLGDGVGMAGGVAANVGLSVAGGGEGAIFTIAYEIGVPGALTFLLFYALLMRVLWPPMRMPGAPGDTYRALVSALIGVMTSFITSEHILTYSGMGSLWLLVGAAIGVQPRLAELAEGEPEAAFDWPAAAALPDRRVR